MVCNWCSSSDSLPWDSNHALYLLTQSEGGAAGGSHPHPAPPPPGWLGNGARTLNSTRHVPGLSCLSSSTPSVEPQANCSQCNPQYLSLGKQASTCKSRPLRQTSKQILHSRDIDGGMRKSREKNKGNPED